MRKTILFCALMISAMSIAQVNWYDVVTADNAGIQYSGNPIGGALYEEVQANADGDLFVTAKISSTGRDPHAVIFEQNVEAVPFKPNMAQTAGAPMFAKVGADGTPKWIVAATDANCTSYASLPLSDGGLLVALVGHRAIVDVLGIASAAYGLPKEQFGLIVKIAADGKPSVLDTITQAAAGKTDGIQLRQIVTDGTNYYVLANLKSAVKIGNAELAPAQAGGSLAILKFNEAGAYKGAIQTSGTAVTATTAELAYANNKLYVVCSLKGTVGGKVAIGETSVTLDNANTNIVVFVANTDLTGSAVKFIPGVVVGGKNSITTYGVAIADGKFFVSGFYMGGLVADGVANNATGKTRAFVASLDLTNDAVSAVMLPAEESGVSSAQPKGLAVKGDSLYAYYYDWGATGDRLFLQTLGTNLKLGSRIGLVNTPSQTATRGMTILGDNVIFTAYTMKGSKNKLSAKLEVEINPTMNCGLIASQKIFGTIPTTAPAIRNEAKGVTKQIKEGNVYVLKGADVYSITGQKVK